MFTLPPMSIQTFLYEKMLSLGIVVYRISISQKFKETEAIIKYSIDIVGAK